MTAGVTVTGSSAVPTVTDPVLEVSDLEVSFPTDDGLVRAVRGVSYQLRRGEVLGIVGESGSGKSVTSLAVTGLLPRNARVSGSVRFRGQELLGASDETMSGIRGSKIAMILQDPMTSLNPVYQVGWQIAEGVRTHRDVGKAQAHNRAVELLDLVGIPNARARADQYPHEYSGGMRQRAVIALAMANDPDVMIADEPTTALDVTIQAQVLEVLARAQKETGAAMVLITHDLGIIASRADRMLVMYAGRAVETGSAEDVFYRPRMPYTLGLLGSLPRLDEDRPQRLTPIVGAPPSLLNLPPGCPFTPRCPLARERCEEDEPALRATTDAAHRAACFFSAELEDARASDVFSTTSADVVDVAELDTEPSPAAAPLESGGEGPRGRQVQERRPAVTAEAAEPTEPTPTGPTPTGPTPASAPTAAPGPAPLPGAVSVTRPPAGANGASTILAVRDLVKHFPVHGRGVLRRVVGEVHAVCGVSFEVHERETLGLVGESGSGKTTTGRAILKLQPATSGCVEFEGRDVTSMSRDEMRRLRRDMQIVFQDPYASLNPRIPVFDIVAEPLRIHRMYRSKGQVRELLRTVGLNPEHGNRYPHEFSGGQRQRIGIARALALRPRFLVLDEPVSALDVSIQAGVINLLEDLQEEFGLAYLFVAHDLSVVRHIADRVAVMYLGKLIEIGERDELFRRPAHPYTQALISAIPIPDPRKERARERILVTGEVPSPVEPPSGCRFRTRCPKYAHELTEAEQVRCRDEVPDLVDRGQGHPSACHYAEVKTLV